VSQQAGFGNNGTEATGSNEPDDNERQKTVKMLRMLLMLSNGRSQEFTAPEEFVTHPSAKTETTKTPAIAGTEAVHYEIDDE
jgi:hypothetical protein